MILLIDNYDSFVHNLARYFRLLGQATRVVRNDQITIADIRELRPEAIVLSPGPCAPQQAGICLELVRELHSEIPILGICLGHQAIAEAFGGKVVRAKNPVHGRASPMHHHQSGLFHDLPSPISVARYHSLIVADLPQCLTVDGELADGTPMALSHAGYPVYGWQFHPESVLTPHGYGLLSSFLNEIGLKVCVAYKTEAEVASRRAETDWFERNIEYPQKID